MIQVLDLTLMFCICGMVILARIKITRHNTNKSPVNTRIIYSIKICLQLYSKGDQYAEEEDHEPNAWLKPTYIIPFSASRFSETISPNICSTFSLSGVRQCCRKPCEKHFTDISLAQRNVCLLLFDSRLWQMTLCPWARHLPYLPRGECPCTHCKSLWIRASAK